MISVELTIDGSGKAIKLIDTSEILRVFGRLSNVSSDVSENNLPNTSERYPRTRNADKLEVDAARLEAENWGLRMLVEELRDSRYRAEQEKTILHEQVRELTNALRLLEQPKTPNSKEKKPGWISRLFRRGSHGE